MDKHNLRSSLLNPSLFNTLRNGLNTVSAVARSNLIDITPADIHWRVEISTHPRGKIINADGALTKILLATVTKRACAWLGIDCCSVFTDVMRREKLGSTKVSSGFIAFPRVTSSHVKTLSILALRITDVNQNPVASPTSSPIIKTQEDNFLRWVFFACIPEKLCISRREVVLQMLSRMEQWTHHAKASEMLNGERLPTEDQMISTFTDIDTLLRGGIIDVGIDHDKSVRNRGASSGNTVANLNYVSGDA